MSGNSILLFLILLTMQCEVGSLARIATALEKQTTEVKP